MIAYAAPTASDVGLPAMFELPGGSLMKYPGRESGLLCALFDRLGLNPAIPCEAEGGSCPDCFRHADPNLDPERRLGGTRDWWNNSSCRNPDFHLPHFGQPQGINLARLENRSALLQ